MDTKFWQREKHQLKSVAAAFKIGEWSKYSREPFIALEGKLWHLFIGGLFFVGVDGDDTFALVLVKMLSKDTICQVSSFAISVGAPLPSRLSGWQD